VEALLGPSRVCTGGVVLGDHGGGCGTYWVRFDGGLEFPAVHEGLLCREVSRVAELEEQLAQLQWRKMQNDAQIRAALEQTRLLQEKDLMKQMEQDRSAEKAEWVRWRAFLARRRRGERAPSFLTSFGVTRMPSNFISLALSRHCLDAGHHRRRAVAAARSV
jgi:hypothetical protein